MKIKNQRSIKIIALFVALAVLVVLSYNALFAQNYLSTTGEDGLITWYEITDDGDTVQLDQAPDLTADTTAAIDPADEDGRGLKEWIADKINVETLLNWQIIGITAIMWLLNFLMGFVPGFVVFKDDATRDLTAKAVITAALVMVTAWAVGGPDGWEIVWAFILATFGYDKLLQPAGLKTKTTAAKK